jgi:hypothetical protein
MLKVLHSGYPNVWYSQKSHGIDGSSLGPKNLVFGIVDRNCDGKYTYFFGVLHRMKGKVDGIWVDGTYSGRFIIRNDEEHFPALHFYFKGKTKHVDLQDHTDIEKNYSSWQFTIPNKGGLLSLVFFLWPKNFRATHQPPSSRDPTKTANRGPARKMAKSGNRQMIFASTCCARKTDVSLTPIKFSGSCYYSR